MNNTNMQSHTIKVNKVIIVIILLMLCITCVAKYFMTGTQISDYITYGILFIGLILAMVFTRKGIYHKGVSMILMFSLLVFQLPNMTYSQQAGMIIMMALCILTLYLDKILLLIWGSLYVIGYIIIQLLNHNIELRACISILLLTSFTILTLYFVCKWGNDLIRSATEKEAHANGLLNSLDNTIKIVHNSTSSLSNDISNCNENIGMLRQISNSMTTTVQEIAKGVTGQSENISQINEMMNNADEKMSEINSLSKSLANISSNISQIVLAGSEEMNNMDKQMRIINTAAAESLTTVEQLNKSMDEINNFLGGITEIAQQTNLLSLNAAIEAARAGDAGKGFSVVADEVRKLADQSANTVKQIDAIISDIKSKTKLVSEKVFSGSAAAKEGELNASQVNESFERITLSFTNIDEYISTKLEMAENISSIFAKIHEQTENIASISEEHSASTEEMLATTEEQNANVENIYALIQNINNSSIKLQELLKKR